MTLPEFLRAYPDDPAAIMSKRIVNGIADYIEELETKIKILEQENDRIAITSSNDDKSTSAAESI